MIVFIIKAIFIFLISYTPLNAWSFLSVPDEDNYFHDIILFHSFAKEYPAHYLKFLFDIEPSDATIFSQYFTQTDAWYKAPEFFYNDNRWVVKIHSILSFISGCNLSVHRLFSVIFSIIGWVFTLNFVQNILSDKFKPFPAYLWGGLFAVSSFFPSFFFFTNFVLKESIMILFAGLLLKFLYEWIIEHKLNILRVLAGSILILISFFFRPAYLLPLIFFTLVFLYTDKYIKKYRSVIFTGLIITLMGLIYILFQTIFDKNIIELIQYRQERFLDASKGGIYLLNTKKFVRVPYNWNNLKIDSTQKNPDVYIKKDVPLMYWYLSDLNDTIISNNKDTTELYHILYYIEKANRTVYVQPLNIQKSFAYNLKSIAQAIHVFFFYPQNIQGIMDIIVWFENILILTMIVLLFIYIRDYPLLVFYLLTFSLYIILIISLSSPNTGAIVRYRFFLLPFLFINIASLIQIRFLNKIL